MNPNNVYINIIGLFWISNVTAIKVILNCFHIDSNSYHNSLTQIMIPTCQAKYHSNAVRIQLPLVLCRLAKPNLSLHVSLPIAFHPLCTDFVNIRKHTLSNILHYYMCLHMQLFTRNFVKQINYLCIEIMFWKILKK